MRAEINFKFNVSVSQISDIPKELFEKIKARQHEEVNWNDDLDLYYELEGLIDFTQAVEIEEIEVTKIRKHNSKKQ